MVPSNSRTPTRAPHAEGGNQAHSRSWIAGISGGGARQLRVGNCVSGTPAPNANRKKRKACHFKGLVLELF